MDRTFKTFTGAALLALAGCGSEEPKENLQAKAEELDTAADRAPDNAQAEVLENQADSLRDAAQGDDKADTEGSVTVIEE